MYCWKILHRAQWAHPIIKLIRFCFFNIPFSWIKNNKKFILYSCVDIILGYMTPLQWHYIGKFDCLVVINLLAFWVVCPFFMSGQLPMLSYQQRWWLHCTLVKILGNLFSYVDPYHNIMQPKDSINSSQSNYVFIADDFYDFISYLWVPLSNWKNVRFNCLVGSSGASSVDSEASTAPADSDNDLLKVSSRKRLRVLESCRRVL